MVVDAPGSDNVISNQIWLQVLFTPGWLPQYMFPKDEMASTLLQIDDNFAKSFKEV